MNFPLGPILLLPAMLAAGPVQPSGGGILTLQGRRYRFEPSSISLMAPTQGLSRSLHLQGRLVPESGHGAFQISMTVLLKGGLYLLVMQRKGRGSYPDTWAATRETQVEVRSLEDRPGGRVVLRCQGPLNGVIALRPEAGSWSGQIWATLPALPGTELK